MFSSLAVNGVFTAIATVGLSSGKAAAKFRQRVSDCGDAELPGGQGLGHQMAGWETKICPSLPREEYIGTNSLTPKY